MTRFFGVFSILCSLCLIGAGVLAHLRGALNLGGGTHLLFGLTAVLLAVSLHCLVFGIFTGAGKDTRELVQDLRLNPEYALRTKAFRKLTFPPALYAIFLLILSAVMGGALGANPASLWLRWGHSLLMWVTVLYNCRAFWVEYRAVRENAFILAALNREAAPVAAEKRRSEGSSPLPGGAPEPVDPIEWGTHVYALGKFLCFLGYNVWLPYIYLKYIVGYFMMPLWPYLVGSVALWLGGTWLRYRYQSFRPSPPLRVG